MSITERVEIEEDTDSHGKSKEEMVLEIKPFEIADIRMSSNKSHSECMAASKQKWNQNDISTKRNNFDQFSKANDGFTNHQSLECQIASRKFTNEYLKPTS